MRYLLAALVIAACGIAVVGCEDDQDITNTCTVEVSQDSDQDQAGDEDGLSGGDVGGQALGGGGFECMQIVPTLTDCVNHQGPLVEFSAEVDLSGIVGEFYITNSRNNPPHENTQPVAIVVILDPSTIEIPKQPVRGGVGGNPHFWFRARDAETDELCGPTTYLGRCVQDG